MEVSHQNHQEKKRKLSNSETTRTWMNTLKKLVADRLFNCEFCGSFFGKNAAVFSVHDVGTVCQSCLNKFDWKGEPLRIFNALLQDLPVVACTNAGCDQQAFPEDVDDHIRHCLHRCVDCISPGCTWRNRLGDLVKHFEDAHKTDVIADKRTFDLDISRGAFRDAKLFSKRNGSTKYFVVIERAQASGDVIIYTVYNRVEECELVCGGNGRVAAGLHCHQNHICVRHFSDATQEYKKQIATEPLQMIDENKNKKRVWHKVSLTVLKEISEGKNTVKVFLKELEKRRSTREGI